jgi:catechol 2,3-dioxygenase-like lactoylglutathione lyase family enzyme
MSIEPNHTIVGATDKHMSARFLAGILGLAVGSRIRDAGLAYFADPGFQQPGEINTRWGGRGVYFRDPDGHSMEMLTQTP